MELGIITPAGNEPIMRLVDGQWVIVPPPAPPVTPEATAP